MNEPQRESRSQPVDRESPDWLAQHYAEMPRYRQSSDNQIADALGVLARAYLALRSETRTPEIGKVCMDGIACKKPGECRARGKCAVFGKPQYAEGPTPRTDAAPPVYDGFPSTVSREFARQLERELNALRSAVAPTDMAPYTTHGILDNACNILQAHGCDRAAQVVRERKAFIPNMPVVRDTTRERQLERELSATKDSFNYIAKEGLNRADEADALRSAIGDRWQAGLRFGFPEFCSHWEGAPDGTGVGWYHELTGDQHFRTAEEAMDAAIATTNPPDSGRTPK